MKWKIGQIFGSEQNPHSWLSQNRAMGKVQNFSQQKIFRLGILKNPTFRKSINKDKKIEIGFIEMKLIYSILAWGSCFENPSPIF